MDEINWEERFNHAREIISGLRSGKKLNELQLSDENTKTWLGFNCQWMEIDVIRCIVLQDLKFRFKPEPVKRWVNVYQHGRPWVYPTEEMAKEAREWGGKTICVEFDQ